MKIPNPRFIKAAKLRLEGALINAPSDLQFDPAYSYTYCRLCGEVFQRARDRDPNASIPDLLDNMEIRKAWSHRHARRHPQRLHDLLAASGLWCSPEAALKLEPFGIVPVGSGVLHPEVRAALEEAPRLPLNDVEGS